MIIGICLILIGIYVTMPKEIIDLVWDVYSKENVKLAKNMIIITRISALNKQRKF